MQKLLLLSLLTAATAAQAQQVRLTGRVTDEQNRPVPYATVGLPGNEPGTSTNEAGEFSLRLEAAPRQLVVVCLGYQPAVVAVASAATPLAVVLKASTVALPEVRVRNPGQVATALVERAYAKLARHARDEHYGKAFYRQKQRHNQEYNEFLDAFYTVRLSNQRVEGWQLEQARYGTVPDKQGVSMDNFSAAVRLIPIFEPRPSRRTLAVPLSPLAAEQFTFQLREVQEANGQETAVIDYAPRPDLGQPAPEGTLYLDMNTAALRRLEARVPIGELTSFQLGEGTTLESQSLRLVSDFVPVADSLSRLSATRAEETIVLRYQNRPDTTHIEGRFFVYDYTGKPAGRAYRTTGVNYDDLKKVMKQPYNADFWRDRAILRASPVEEKVIRDLETRKGFGPPLQK